MRPVRTGKEASEVEKQEEEKGLFPPEYFDRVLLDPPCSGLGLLLFDSSHFSVFLV
jgi:16S rRNA C967 or C1407 C5-methylase (RsmB/RsmF family)